MMLLLQQQVVHVTNFPKYLLGIILKLFYGFSCFEATVVGLDLHGSLFSLLKRIHTSNTLIALPSWGVSCKIMQLCYK